MVRIILFGQKFVVINFFYTVHFVKSVCKFFLTIIIIAKIIMLIVIDRKLLLTVKS